jgi:hypothetical protein
VSDRDAFREAREHGLKARHETREARAVRREIGEEIAKAIENHFPDVHDEDTQCARCFLVHQFAKVAREIGSKGGSDE